MVADQASIVRRIFDGFCCGRSCNSIANQLNREGVPTFAAGRWHPLTVRRILQNETYTGRTVYRRTRTVKTRDPLSGKSRVQVRPRDESEWIDIKEATPAIISCDTFEHARAIVSDPARRLRGQASQHYRLRGHIFCLTCGTRMVGHAQMHGRYRYYRCRRTYAGSAEGKCNSRYVSADRLEHAVLQELSQVLSDPDRIIAEATQLNERDEHSSQLLSKKEELGGIEAQQRRLTHLYTSGIMPYDILTEENDRLQNRRAILDREIQTLERLRAPEIDINRLRRELPRVVEALRTWILSASADDTALLLRALQVRVAVSHDHLQIDGALPVVAPTQQDFVTIEQTSA